MRHIPFARWETFDACVLEQTEAGHDDESARKICGAIQERAEKGELYKSADQQNYDVICKSDSELVIGGFASWELVDPENDLITAEAQAKYLQKLFKLPVEYRNIMVGHGNFKIGEPLLKYVKDGQEYFSHVNEKGLYLISKIRNDGFKTTQKWREKILKGEMSMYSIAGLPLESEVVEEGGTKIRKVHDIEPWEITVCEKGVNPKAEFKILAKETPILVIASAPDEGVRHQKNGEKERMSTEKTEKPEQAPTPIAKTPIAKTPIAKAEDQTLIDRIMHVMEEVMKSKMDSFEKKIDEKIETILKSKEVEVEKALRKGFGLENDPVVHMSDMIEFGRKSALEKAETGKRTPAPETLGGPEGNTQLSPIDELFAKAKKGELA